MSARHAIARRMAAGSGALARRPGAWVAAGETPGAKACRAGGAAVGTAFGLQVLHNAPGLTWLLALGAASAAWQAGQPEPGGEAAEEQEDQELGAVEFAELLNAEIGNANGAHLSAIAARLDASGIAPGWTTAEVRQQCQALGIRIRPSLKVAGKVSPGVHRDDLTAACSSPPLAPLLAGQVGGSSAGQDPTTPPTTYPATRVEEIGAGAALIVHTGEHRHHTV